MSDEPHSDPDGATDDSPAGDGPDAPADDADGAGDGDDAPADAESAGFEFGSPEPTDDGGDPGTASGADDPGADPSGSDPAGHDPVGADSADPGGAGTVEATVEPEVESEFDTGDADGAAGSPTADTAPGGTSPTGDAADPGTGGTTTGGRTGGDPETEAQLEEELLGPEERVGPGQQLCADCESLVDQRAQVCPDCGTALDGDAAGTGHDHATGERAGAGEVYCTSCGAAVNERAEICPECGVRQPTDTGTSPAAGEPARTTRNEGPFEDQSDPTVAGLASGLVPGLGQIYNGRTGRGLVAMGAWLLLTMINWTVVPALVTIVIAVVTLGVLSFLGPLLGILAALVVQAVVHGVAGYDAYEYARGNEGAVGPGPN